MSPTISSLPAPDPTASAHPHARLGLVLGVASGIGAVLVIPYLAAITPEIGEAGVPLWLIAIASGIQNGLMASVMAIVGLKAGRHLGLGAPKLFRWVNRGLKPEAALGATDLPAQPPADGWPGLAIAVVGAMLLAGLVAVVDALWLLPHLEPIKEMPASPGPLLGLLASVYGGIAEEVIVRLFAMSGIAWLLWKARVRPRTAILMALVLSAVIFGVSHLPTAMAIFKPTGMLVFRTVALNMALGIPFGILFYKRGLEQAIVAHFAADLVLHVFLPLMAGG